MVIATILTSLIVWVVPMFSFESMGRVLVNLSALFVVVGIIIFTGLNSIIRVTTIEKNSQKKDFLDGKKTYKKENINPIVHGPLR